MYGLNGNSKCWGVSPDTITINGIKIKSDSINKDSMINGKILPVCLEKLKPMVWVWDTLGYDTSYTIPGGIPGHEEPDPAYPNKTFLEVTNEDDPVGSINPETTMVLIVDLSGEVTRIDSVGTEYYGQGTEVGRIIRSVLGEYYGTGPEDTTGIGTWKNDTSAKIIIVAHSLGGLNVREAIRENPIVKNHIEKVITLGSPHNGTDVADLQYVINAIEDIYFLIQPSDNPIRMIKQFHILNSFTPAGYDACVGSEFLQVLNSEYEGGNYKWYNLVGRLPWGWADPAGSVAIVTGASLMAAGLIPPTNMAFFWAGYTLTSGGTVLIYWNHNSDDFIPTYSANINRALPQWPYNAKVKEVAGLDHTSEPKQWEIIRNFIEYRPRVYIDSVLIEKDSMSDTIVALHPDGIDTLPGKPKEIYGRIDEYFLASMNDAYLKLNNYKRQISFGRDTDRGTELGLNGNNFVVDVDPDWVYTGINRINICSKNKLAKYYGII